MTKIETNIFEIENLDELDCHYRIYKVLGFNKDSEDYEKNISVLLGNLRSLTKSPCVEFKEGKDTYIAQPVGYPDPPEKLNIIRQTIKIEEMPEGRLLRFSELDENSIPIAIRFLKFFIEQPLYDNPNLWQPKAGAPFFNKVPDKKFKEINSKVNLYRGFKFRLLVFDDNRIGVCIDTSSKYVSNAYLPEKIDENDINRYKGKTVLYEYGDLWYEIRIAGLSPLPIGDIEIDGVSLFDNVHKQAGKAKSPRLVSLPKDCSAFYYINTFGMQRNAPTALCRYTFKTNHPQISKFHKATIKNPNSKNREIKFIVERNLQNIKFGSKSIRISKSPISVNENLIPIPDIEFGNSKVLSVNTNNGAEYVPIKKIGIRKSEAIYSNDVGLYKADHFDRQYFIIPKSIYDAYGQIFIDDLKSEVNKFYSSDKKIEYEPSVIPYDDSVRKSIYNLGKEIINTIKANASLPGYAVVMIPRLSSDKTKEDELANLVTRKARELSIHASIIHTDTVEKSFEYMSNDTDESNYRLINDRKIRGKYVGYTKNVALNKVILNNNHWPFILRNPLNADLTIGIDVKNNTAGFTFVYKNGKHIRFFSSTSRQKEKLLDDQLQRKLYDFIENEQKLLNQNIANIVIHRDGKLYPCEISGIKKAVAKLSNNGIINENASVTFTEIRKTMSAPLRLFRKFVLDGSNQEIAGNPKMGTYFLLSDNEFFICNTGYPYKYDGTTNPLHVIKREGNLSINKIIEDLFNLSNLTWTKIDYCSRFPITTKLNDIRLKEIAGDYDEDSLEFLIDEEGEINE